MRGQFHKEIYKLDCIYFKIKKNHNKPGKMLFDNFFKHLRSKVNLKLKCFGDQKVVWAGEWMDGWVLKPFKEWLTAIKKI